MARYLSHMIGIRTGGVFNKGVDIDDMKKRISKIILDMPTTVMKPNNGEKAGDPSNYMSRKLTAHKGSYVVLAGVFNYWDIKSASEFVKRLSKEFATDVMHMAWDEETDETQCQIWFNGDPLLESPRDVISRILRRTT